jgi:outer membrane protein OmpA-like peptidoglycan-associated protein
MRRPRSLRLAALALCVPFGVTTTTGCGSVRELVFGEEFEFHCPQPAHTPVAIAVGARANSPAPALPAEVRKLIAEGMTGCAKVTVIRVDGRPAVAGSAVFTTTARTEQNFNIDKAEFLKKVGAMLTDARAQAAEANVLGALGLAAAAAGPGGTVVLLDSGIQTADPIDFRKNKLPTKQPKAIADALRRQGLLPDLRERTVILSGLGYSAAPQAALDDHNRTFVVELWREIVAAGGVKDPTLLVEPNTTDSATKTPAVSVVDFPIGQILFECNAVAVLPDDDEVGFIPDQAELRNVGAARAVFQRFAEFLRTNPAATVEIQGFVAHYGHGNLSQQRADRVKQELIALGVKNSLTATGMGWGPFPHPSASPDPRYDQLNRRVTISVKCG